MNLLELHELGRLHRRMQIIAGLSDGEIAKDAAVSSRAKLIRIQPLYTVGYTSHHWACLPQTS
jgi:hypothetical protein